MYIFLLIAVLVLGIICLFNRKINVFKIVVKQFMVYKNDKTQKTSVFDIITFYIIPLFMSVGFTFLIDYNFVYNSAGLLITILSIIATILFSFLALLIDKKKSSNDKVVQVTNETHISIMMTIIYAVISVAIIVILLLIPHIEWLIKVINVLIYYLILKIFLNILMILKRMFLLLDNDE